jgi:tetratricopeptide (TPR) repeat protein
LTINPNLEKDDEDANKVIKKALVIGVSDYEDKRLEPLPFCKNDAEEMYRLLTSPKLGFEIPDSNKMICKVQDREMKKSIVKFFKDRSVNAQDTLLLYFAGHGVTDDYGDVFIASSETDSKEPFNGGFPFRELTKFMNRSYSTRIITTLDCCHSGAFELTTGSRGDPNDEAEKAHNDMEDKSKALKQGRGKFLIAACESIEEAYDIKEKNHGIFTYYLLEGLKGKPQSVDEYGNVTVDRLADYVYDTISSLPPKKKPNQMPIRKAEGGGRIILAYHPELAKHPSLGGQTSQKEYSSAYTPYKLGERYLKGGRSEEAIKYYDKAIEIAPYLADAWYNRGVALYNLGRYEEAIESYDRALEINPKDDYNWVTKGRALYKLGRYEEAIESYDRALEINPNNDYAWVKKGVALYKLGRYEEAIESYDRALEINPKYTKAWEKKGDTLDKLGRTKEAIECRNKAKELDNAS